MRRRNRIAPEPPEFFEGIDPDFDNEPQPQELEPGQDPRARYLGLSHGEVVPESVPIINNSSSVLAEEISRDELEQIYNDLLNGHTFVQFVTGTDVRSIPDEIREAQTQDSAFVDTEPSFADAERIEGSGTRKMMDELLFDILNPRNAYDNKKENRDAKFLA